MLEDFENSLTATSGLVTELRQAAGTDETERIATLFRNLVMTVSAYQGDLTVEIESYCDNPRESDWQRLVSMVGALAENVRRITKGLEREEGDFIFDAGRTYRDLALGMGSRQRVLAEVEAMRFPPSADDLARLRAIAAKYRTLVADLHRNQDDLAQWIRDAREKQEERPVDLKTVRTDVVILVHGIRDFALWQNSVRSSLEKAGFTVEATNYGRLNLLRFLMPFRWVRAFAIKAVAKQIRMVELRHPNKRISVIAHSFGTHVIASLLRDEFDTRFHRMIFCGSVVQYDFPFEQCVGRFEPELLNEVGTADIWPAIAESVTVGYGSAGTYGFRRPFVRDRWHNGAAHGFFLTPEFATKFWVPFLATGKVVPGSDPAKEPSAWLKLFSVFKIKYVILLALLAGIVAALVAIMPVLPAFRGDGSAKAKDVVQLDLLSALNVLRMVPETERQNICPTLISREDCARAAPMIASLVYRAPSPAQSRTIADVASRGGITESEVMEFAACGGTLDFRVVNYLLSCGDGTPLPLVAMSSGARPMAAQEAIVLHATATSKQSPYASVVNLIANGRPPQLSGPLAHLVISRNGAIAQTAPFDRKANHVGVAGQWHGVEIKNANAIGIEMINTGDYANDPYSPTQIKATEAVILALRKAYGIRIVVGHDEVALPHGRKTDPGPGVALAIRQGLGSPRTETR